MSTLISKKIKFIFSAPIIHKERRFRQGGMKYGCHQLFPFIFPSPMTNCIHWIYKIFAYIVL